MKTIRAVVVDDHPVFRQGLVFAVDKEADMTVVKDLGDGKQLLTYLAQDQPDVVLLDMMMPGMTGVDVARELKVQYPDIRVVILTGLKDEDTFNQALDAGVRGFILKENAIADIIDCIRRVAAGDTYISPALSSFLIRQAREEKNEQEDFLSTLTPSELRILKLIALDRTSKQIAEELFVSPKTVENHRANICRKLEINGSNSLLKFVMLNRDKLSELVAS